MARRNRTSWLRQHFGPEYDNALTRYGDRRRAESALAQRRDRVAGAPIRPLRPEEKELLASRWHDLQARFPEAPRETLKDAQALVDQTMRDCGYQIDDFETRADDFSVNHPHVVQNYRSAHEIASRPDAGIDDLRQALFQFRTVFEELLELHGVH